MMYHLSSKTTKQLLQTARRTVLSAASQQPMAPPQRAYFVAHKQQQMKFMLDFQRRQFSLPPHVKLEMPNLSPTMEKVILKYNHTS
jgi:hypothetical protein